MTLTAVWLVLVLLASWASTARADDVLSPSGPDTPSNTPPPAPGPADGGTGQPGGSSDPGTPPPSAGDSGNPAPSPTQPTDPPPPQGTGTPVDTTPSSPPADSSPGGSAGSPTDSSPGAGTPTDPPPNSGSSDPNKASPTPKSGTDSTATAAPSGSTDQFAGPTPASASQPSALALSGPGDEMWVDQWSAFTHPDPIAMLRQTLRPGIRFVRGGSFALFRTSKAKQLEARARQQGETAKASPLGGPGVLHGAPGSAAGVLDLLTGNGSGSGVLMIFGFLGILAITLLPIPSRTRALRLPAVTWRPSAYVPPIEQPG